MTSHLRLGAAVFALFVLAIAGWRGADFASAQSDAFSEPQVQAIQKIMKDYLVSHPEILFEAQEAYQQKVEGQRAEAQRSRMPEFYKALDSMKAELASFTVGTGKDTMIEFFDYNCGYCRAALPEVLKLADADKDLKILFIEFPILAPGSQEASKVAVAAAKQGKYFEFHREMFAAGRASKDSAMKVAEKIGLDMDKVKAVAAAPETEALLAKLNELARGLYIDGTPSFLIGDKLNPGAADFDQLKQMVEQLRKNGCKSCSTDASAGSQKTEKKS